MRADGPPLLTHISFSDPLVEFERERIGAHLGVLVGHLGRKEEDGAPAPTSPPEPFVRSRQILDHVLRVTPRVDFARHTECGGHAAAGRRLEPQRAALDHPIACREQRARAPTGERAARGSLVLVRDLTTGLGGASGLGSRVRLVLGLRRLE